MRRIAWVASASLLAVAVAIVVYRPWEATHLSVRDQVILLAGLPSGEPWMGRTLALMERLRDEGRFYPVSSALLTLYGSAFDRDAALWQWTRLALTLLGAALAYPTLRRLGAGALGAFVGSALFLVAERVVQATNYVLVWESHGIPLFLAAVYLGAGYQRDPRPVRTAVAISLLMVLAVWAKEPFLACVPFVLLVGLCHAGKGDYQWPALSSRNAILASSVVGAVLLLCLVPILAAKAGVTASGHATHYTLSAVTLRHAVNVATVMLALATRAVHYPTNFLLYGLTAVSAALALRRGDWRNVLLAGAIALSLPLAGWVIYLPWRFTPGYYGLPFLLGPALLVALAITTWRRDAGFRLRAVPAVLAGVALFYAALVAYNATGAFYTHTHVEGEVARTLADARANGSFVIGVPDPAVSGRFGTELGQYARALGAGRDLTIEDVTCDAAAARAANAAAAGTILLSHWCPGAAPISGQPAARAERSYTSIDWKSLGVSRVRVSGMVWGL